MTYTRLPPPLPEARRAHAPYCPRFIAKVRRRGPEVRARGAARRGGRGGGWRRYRPTQRSGLRVRRWRCRHTGYVEAGGGGRAMAGDRFRWAP